MTAEPLILLVEDEADDVELTQRAFRTCLVRNRLVVVRDGVEALEWLFRTGRYADRDVRDVAQLVLLDLKLPRLDGLEVLARMRADERTRRVPVVVLSGSVEDLDTLRSYELGANSYVRKPVDFHDFVDAARQLGLYWLVLNQPASEA